MSADADAVLLVKPLFEVGRERLARTGVVTSPTERQRALEEVLQATESAGLHRQGLEPSPVRGTTGTQEYLLWVTTGLRPPREQGAP